MRSPDNLARTFGTTTLSLPKGQLEQVEDKIFSTMYMRFTMVVAPNEMMYVKRECRSGILPVMLNEILDTRIMVKKVMKQVKNNKGLQRTLNAKQMGLKMIANVTYGYTGAGFSGRM